MKRIGEVFGIPVLTSEWVEKEQIYLLNPASMKVIAKFTGFKALTPRDKIRWYFKNLLKALLGRAV